MSSIEATRPSAALSCGTWTIDPAHSCVGFRVTHLGLTDVRGRFADFCGSLVVTAKGAIDAEGTVTAVSIDTGQPQRDDHLRGPEFLDAATHPQISFRSTMFEPLGQGTFRVTGDLTIHGVTRESPSTPRSAGQNRTHGATRASGSPSAERSTAPTTDWTTARCSRAAAC